MDLSGIIFVVLAVGWAAYLLPLAPKNHDDADLSRPVEEFSDKLRVLGGALVHRTGPAAATPAAEAREERTPARPAFTVSREAARAAARRRRRVLGLLLTILVAVSVTSYLGYTPWYTTAIPAGLVLAFLVVARLTVRAQQVRRVAPAQQKVQVDEAADIEPVEMRDLEPDLGTEDTTGLSRAELADAVAAPVLDEGGLWDPLPVTLPTYVTKPRARRTVRTIELTAGTAGVTSSGHDAADSALAAEAAASVADDGAQESVETRKAAGA